MTHDGRQGPLVVPAPRANGAALREVFLRWQGSAGLDDQFAANVDAAREASAGEDVDSWRD